MKTNHHKHTQDTHTDTLSRRLPRLLLKASGITTLAFVLSLLLVKPISFSVTSLFAPPEKDDYTIVDFYADVADRRPGDMLDISEGAVIEIINDVNKIIYSSTSSGFEKPYFVEEILYYDKCDCEDRAIAFTWLLWNALGIPNQLIAYPMHESASVSLDADSGVSGYSYTVDGATYYSADPTYIGSKVGDVMPQFATVSPKVDKTYR